MRATVGGPVPAGARGGSAQRGGPATSAAAAVTRSAGPSGPSPLYAPHGAASRGPAQSHLERTVRPAGPVYAAAAAAGRPPAGPTGARRALGPGGPGLPPASSGGLPPYRAHGLGVSDSGRSVDVGCSTDSRASEMPTPSVSSSTHSRGSYSHQSMRSAHLSAWNSGREETEGADRASAPRPPRYLTGPPHWDVMREVREHVLARPGPRSARLLLALEERTKSSPASAGFKDFFRALRAEEARGLAACMALASHWLAKLSVRVHWRVLLELAELAKRRDSHHVARCLYRRAVRLQPFAAQAWLEFAKMEDEAGRHKRARALLHAGLAFCPLDELLLMKGIKAESALGNLTTARSLLSRLPQLSLDRAWRVALVGATMEARRGGLDVSRCVLASLVTRCRTYGPVFLDAVRFEERHSALCSAAALVQRGLDAITHYGPLWFAALRVYETAWLLPAVVDASDARAQGRQGSEEARLARADAEAASVARVPREAVRGGERRVLYIEAGEEPSSSSSSSPAAGSPVPSTMARAASVSPTCIIGSGARLPRGMRRALMASAEAVQRAASSSLGAGGRGACVVATRAPDPYTLSALVGAATAAVSRELTWKLHLEGGQLLARQQEVNACVWCAGPQLAPAIAPCAALSDAGPALRGRLRASLAPPPERGAAVPADVGPCVRHHLSIALAHAPKNLRWKVWVAGARAELALGCPDAARTAIRSALACAGPKCLPAVLIECARLEECVGDTETAEEVLQAAKLLAPRDWKVCLELVLLARRHGRMHEALLQAMDSLNEHSGTGRLWAALIQLRYPFSVADQYHTLSTALLRVPKSGEVWCEGARLHLNPISPRFDLSLAVKFLGFAVRFTPQFGDSFVEMVRAHLLHHVARRPDRLVGALRRHGFWCGPDPRRWGLCSKPKWVAKQSVWEQRLIFAARIRIVGGGRGTAHGAAPFEVAPSAKDGAEVEVVVRDLARTLEAAECALADVARVLEQASALDAVRRAVEADPNYGSTFYHAKLGAHEGAARVLRRAHTLMAWETPFVLHHYVAALLREHPDRPLRGGSWGGGQDAFEAKLLDLRAALSGLLLVNAVRDVAVLRRALAEGPSPREVEAEKGAGAFDPAVWSAWEDRGSGYPGNMETAPLRGCSGEWALLGSKFRDCEPEERDSAAASNAAVSADLDATSDDEVWTLGWKEACDNDPRGLEFVTCFPSLSRIQGSVWRLPDPHIRRIVYGSELIVP